MFWRWEKHHVLCDSMGFVLYNANDSRENLLPSSVLLIVGGGFFGVFLTLLPMRQTWKSDLGLTLPVSL
jgi:hypothetical protein